MLKRIGAKIYKALRKLLFQRLIEQGKGSEKKVFSNTDETVWK